MKKALLFIPLCVLFVAPAIAQRGYVKDKIEDDNRQKHGEPGMEKYNDWMSGKVLNVKTEPEYVFTTSVTMDMYSYKKGKKGEPAQMKYFLNPGKTYFATNAVDKKGKDEMFMIYELINNYMLMLDVKKKTGMAINMNAFMSGKAIEARDKRIANGEAKSDPDNECKMTGNTKTILGYPCQEFVCIDKDKGTKSEMWLSTKLPVDISRAYMQGPYAAYFRNTGKMGGFMMEANFYKNGELESTMIVTEVNTSANRKEVMSEYKLNGM